MGLPPSLHPQQVRRAAKVIPPLGRSPPAVLAGGLAGLAAGRLRAVLLVPAVAPVGGVQLPAVMALTTTFSGHGRLQSQNPHDAPTHAIPEENATAKRPTPHRRRRRKKTISNHSEENTTEEYHIFKPADLPHYQNGDDTLFISCYKNLQNISKKVKVRALNVRKPRPRPETRPCCRQQLKTPFPPVLHPLAGLSVTPLHPRYPRPSFLSLPPLFSYSSSRIIILKNKRHEVTVILSYHHHEQDYEHGD